MRNAAKALWLGAREPNPRKPIRDGEASCCWCGSPTERWCRTKDVFGSSFTDHDQMLLPTDAVCVPCSWAFTGRPPDTLRLWSVVYREDRGAAPSHPKARDMGPFAHLQNKADPTEFRAILADPPSGNWICSVADSGQIHVLPFARVNTGAERWNVRFERQDVTARPEEYRALHGAMQSLYDAGYSKDDIASGPSPGRIFRAGINLWRTHDPLLRRYRGGPLFNLTLFLLRKTEDP